MTCYRRVELAWTNSLWGFQRRRSCQRCCGQHGEAGAGEENPVTISGGEIKGCLRAYENSQISIYGPGFNFGFGAITATSGRLTGTLADGTPINCDFYIYDNASVVLVPAPGALILGTIGAGLVGWLSRLRTL